MKQNKEKKEEGGLSYTADCTGRVTRYQCPFTLNHSRAIRNEMKLQPLTMFTSASLVRLQQISDFPPSTTCTKMRHFLEWHTLSTAGSWNFSIRFRQQRYEQFTLFYNLLESSISEFNSKYSGALLRDTSDGECKILNCQLNCSP